jgi:peptidoglycan/xylan/chitin deacetylase (PgdA/CDA1 family)
MIAAAFFRLAESCGLNRLWAYFNRRSVLILTYHGVTDGPPGEPGQWLTYGPLPRDALRLQLRALRRRYTIIPLAEAIEMVRGRRPMRPNCVVLTFDDGYRNNAAVAAPVLREFGATATIFLATDFVSGRAPLWFDRIDYALARTNAAGITLALDGQTRTLPLGNRRARSAALESLKARLKRMDVHEAETVVESIEQSAGVRLADAWRDDPRAAPMTWDEARALLAAGFSFGAHTASHQILAAASEARVAQELADSRVEIERELGVPCTHFAYPNGQPGDFNAATRDALREAGFDCAVTTVHGRNRVGDDLFELRRVAAGRRVDAYKFLAELSGLLPWLLGWREWWRGRRAPRGKPTRSGVAAGPGDAADVLVR